MANVVLEFLVNGLCRALDHDGKPIGADFDPYDSVVPAVCPEGEECLVEPDGTCPHGGPSVLLVAGLI
jgi:hypothetical protein